LKYRTVYFCGYAKLPQSISANNVYNILTLGLLIDVKAGIIERVSCTLLSSLATEIVSSYFINRHVVNDYDEIITEISFRHQGQAQKSIIKAFCEIHKKYIEFAKEHKVKELASI